MQRLTDRSALARNRIRATEDFLHRRAKDDVEDRLAEVNRTFTRVAVVTGRPELWRHRPDATVVADDETLAIAPGAHDLVIHDMSLHWADDPVGQLVQSRRALEPDGMLIATLFGGQTLTELRAALAQAESAVTGGLSPRIAPMAEIRDLGGLLQRAGFALPVADGDTVRTSYRDLPALMRDLRAMGEGNALADRLRVPTNPAVLRTAADLYAAHFSDAEGRLRATFEIITLTGWAPSADQPQPLRPGSATTRLADALGTVENPRDLPSD